jgi:hypothetical protein
MAAASRPEPQPSTTVDEHVAVERFRHDRHALRDEESPERSLSNPGGDEQGRVG